jgi:uncharacterized membrane protein YqjE
MASVDRSISVVLQDIVGNVQDIVRAEVRLAKTEVGEELGKARSAGMLFGVGAVTAIFTAFFLLLAIVYALSLVMPEWAAVLIVAAGIGVVAAMTLSLGIKRFRTIHAAPKTAASLKENVQWAKQLTKLRITSNTNART